MDKEIIQQLLYDDTIDEVISKVKKISDEKTLFVFAHNYNWDNGFEIPSEILKNTHCSLSIALMLFFDAGGMEYLKERKENPNLPAWTSFVQKLYNDIMKEKYQIGKTAYKIPLTKIEIFKVNKVLQDNEKVFLHNIEGEDCNIII